MEKTARKNAMFAKLQDFEKWQNWLFEQAAAFAKGSI